MTNVNMVYLYQLITQGLGVLSLLAYVGGFATCLVHRRLSPWLYLVAASFVGLSVSSLISRLAMYLLTPLPDLLYLAYIVATIIDVLSNFMLAFGFALVLVQIRHKLTIAMEPPYVRS